MAIKKQNRTKPIETIEFSVSQPVFVSWGFDWEGWEIPTQTLSSIDSISSKYGSMPFTHFFNPRIFINTDGSAEKQDLISWINNRSEKYGDEIALHMHMHFDLVEKAGITPKQSPKWGYRSNEGYDVLTTSYSKEEFGMLIDFAINKFLENGLPIPLGYRAGGWFADVSTLEILAEKGFAYDSSGRNPLNWNGTKKIPWNLTSVTQPYYPSLTDQNISGEDNLEILEIPNNGGNTYENTSDQLIEKFKENFSGGFSQNKRSIVFLSHPQWSDKEFPRMDKALEYISSFLLENDSGPVVFVTTYDIYNIWK